MRISDWSSDVCSSDLIASVSDLYDVVILDPPPALGAISLSVLRAANVLIVPVPPTVMDFSSTAAFLAMLADTIEELKERDLAPKLSLLRFVASKVDENKSKIGRAHV